MQGARREYKNFSGYHLWSDCSLSAILDDSQCWTSPAWPSGRNVVISEWIIVRTGAVYHGPTRSCIRELYGPAKFFCADLGRNFQRNGTALCLQEYRCINSGFASGCELKAISRFCPHRTEIRSVCFRKVHKQRQYAAGMKELGHLPQVFLSRFHQVVPVVVTTDNESVLRAPGFAATRGAEIAECEGAQQAPKKSIYVLH